MRPVDAAGDTKRTLNSLVAQNNKLQHEIKKAKEREDIAVGKAQQTETVKNVLEKRVLELLADKDEVRFTFHVCLSVMQNISDA